MKIRWMMMTVAMLVCASVAKAQEDPADVYTGPAGIPGTPAAPPLPPDDTPGGGAVAIYFYESVLELTITPIDCAGGSVTSDDYNATSAIPGDVVFLANPAGGDAPSNWAAVAQFFSPMIPPAQKVCWPPRKKASFLTTSE